MQNECPILIIATIYLKHSIKISGSDSLRVYSDADPGTNYTDPDVVLLSREFFKWLKGQCHENFV